MSATSLPVSAPSAQGVDARGIGAFLDALQASPGVEMHSLMVVAHGHVVAQGWWAPYTEGAPHLLYSVSKSFTSTALGFAVTEGLVRLDDPVLAYFPELDDEVGDPRSRSMLVRHIAAMSSGHLSDMISVAAAIDPTNPVRGFLLSPPERDPGSVFTYNQMCTFTLGEIVARTSGQSLTQYLRPRLLDPLGIGDVGWTRDASGRELGYSGLHAPTQAVAKLGLLYLDRGAWQGQPLLDPAWIEAATRAHVSTAAEANPDWAQGYGFQFWRSRHGYRADGAYGQFALVLPEQDAVIAMTAATVETPRVLDAVWEHLLPAFDAVDRDEGAQAGIDADLRERLEGLTVAPVTGVRAAPAGRDGDEWAGSFAPAHGECVAQPSLSSVDLVRDADAGDDCWSVILVDGDGPGSVRLTGTLGFSGVSAWTSSNPLGPDARPVPIAISGGWSDARTLRFDVLFTQTPHRLAISCALPERTFEARWVTTPLHGTKLSALRSPKP